MTANEYQREALRTASRPSDYRFINDNLNMALEGAIGLCGESGEVADIIKKVVFHGHSLDNEHLAEEIGDALWYLALIAHAIGYDLDTICRLNIDKLYRRYPDGFSAERSVRRDATELKTAANRLVDAIKDEAISMMHAMHKEEKPE